MPQLRFNEDGEWHDFAPEGWTGLKAGPWFPLLFLFRDDRLSDHRVDRPRATKSAGKINKALAGAASDDDGAGAAPVEGDESVLLQHENAQHEEACGSK